MFSNMASRNRNDKRVKPESNISIRTGINVTAVFLDDFAYFDIY